MSGMLNPTAAQLALALIAHRHAEDRDAEREQASEDRIERMIDQVEAQAKAYRDKAVEYRLQRDLIDKANAAATPTRQQRRAAERRAAKNRRIK